MQERFGKITDRWRRRVEHESVDVVTRAGACTFEPSGEFVRVVEFRVAHGDDEALDDLRQGRCTDL